MRKCPRCESQKVHWAGDDTTCCDVCKYVGTDYSFEACESCGHLRAEVDRLKEERDAANRLANSHDSMANRLFDEKEAAEQERDRLRAEVEQLKIEQAESVAFDPSWQNLRLRAEAAEKKAERYREEMVLLIGLVKEICSMHNLPIPKASISRAEQALKD